jgi:fumarate reductase subunit D
VYLLDVGSGKVTLSTVVTDVSKRFVKVGLHTGLLITSTTTKIQVTYVHVTRVIILNVAILSIFGSALHKIIHNTWQIKEDDR